MGDDVSNADEFAVLTRNLNCEVALVDLKPQPQLFFAAELALLPLDDLRCPMGGINDSLSDLKLHRVAPYIN